MTLEKDIEHLAKKLYFLADKEIPAAHASAINKVTAKAKTRIVKGVAKSNNLPQKEVRKKVFISRASAKKIKSSITHYRNNISLMSLKAKQTKKGVRASGKRNIAGAFIAVGKGGKQHVFKRSTSARLPISRLSVTIKKSVDKIVPLVVERVVKSDLELILVSELNYRIGKHTK